ncbi:uncharacterized protein BYT42DRAFT_491509, partial [Radiomyces spectabilis]|uniref:uncharacterized protein n=1 Tax=Radiomyces spectabilis TaxID=64574 RepID=UPI00222034C8
WARFWSIPLTSVTRNLWYRILHSKLPSRTFLHRLLPTVHLTDQCPLCTISTDTPVHFLYQCPPKRVVWESVWPDLLLLPVNETQILKALYQLDFPRDPPNCKSVVIIEAILHGIWSAHWAFIFYHTVFNPEEVINRIHKLISRRIAESQLPALLS